MTTLTLTTLYTAANGRARFRDDALPLAEGTSAARLSALMASGGCQSRHSPAGFASSFHCTTTPQWLVVLQGRMEIGLQDGSTRIFGPGECFYSNDTLPPGLAMAASSSAMATRRAARRCCAATRRYSVSSA